MVSRRARVDEIAVHRQARAAARPASSRRARDLVGGGQRRPAARLGRVEDLRDHVVDALDAPRDAVRVVLARVLLGGVDDPAGVGDEVGRVDDAAAVQVVGQLLAQRAGCSPRRRRSGSAAPGSSPRRARRRARTARARRPRRSSRSRDRLQRAPQLLGQPALGLVDVRDDQLRALLGRASGPGPRRRSRRRRSRRCGPRSPPSRSACRRRRASPPRRPRP